MTARILLITGACGVGKSSIFPIIKASLPEINVHDFDEVGVPELPTIGWRKTITRHWLELSTENLKTEKSTVILGMIHPSEVRELVSVDIQKQIKFLLLDVTIDERNRRFKCRNENRDFLLNERKNLDNLQKWLKKSSFDFEVLDTTKLEIDETANLVVKWVIKNIPGINKKSISPLKYDSMAEIAFRDLGGLSLINGQMTQYGFIFRSGHLASIPVQEQNQLIEQNNIKRVVDFRSDKDIEAYGQYRPDFKSKIQYIRIPIVTENIPRDEKIRRERGWRSYKYLYHHILTNETKVIKNVFELLSEAKDSPILIHCIAGKDRTGILICLLLMAMNVRTEDIIFDYMRTPRSEQTNCLHIIDLVAERGGIFKYLQSIGIDEIQLNKIRDFFVK